MIFMGDIATWDHPAIQALNSNITLPHANITIAVSPGQALAQTDVFKRALSLFSEDFKLELANLGDDLGKMRPAMEGRAFIASDEAGRLQYLQVGSNKLIHFIENCFFTFVISGVQFPSKPTTA